MYHGFVSTRGIVQGNNVSVNTHVLSIVYRELYHDIFI